MSNGPGYGQNKVFPEGSQGLNVEPKIDGLPEQPAESAIETDIGQISKIAKEACEEMCQMLDALIEYYDEVATRLQDILNTFPEHSSFIGSFFDKYKKYRTDWTGSNSWDSICRYVEIMQGLTNTVISCLEEARNDRQSIFWNAAANIKKVPRDKHDAAKQLHVILDSVANDILVAFDKVLGWIQDNGIQTVEKSLSYLLQESGDQGAQFVSSMSMGSVVLSQHFNEIQEHVEFIEFFALKLGKILTELEQDFFYDVKVEAILAEKRAAEDQIVDLIG